MVIFAIFSRAVHLLCMYTCWKILRVLAALVLSKAALFCARAPRWQLVLLASWRPLPGFNAAALFYFSFPLLLFITHFIVTGKTWASGEHKRRERETRTHLCMELHSWPYFRKAYWHKSLSLLIDSSFFWGYRFFTAKNFGGQFFVDQYWEKKWVYQSHFWKLMLVNVTAGQKLGTPDNWHERDGAKDIKSCGLYISSY